MQGELQFLLQLQQHDSAIDEVSEKIKYFDGEIAAKNKQIDEIKASLKNAKDALNAHLLKKKQLEGEAEAKEQQVKKHQGELNSLKSNDQYKAMLGEIEAAKQAVKTIEDSILGLMESIEQEEKKVKVAEQKNKSEQDVIKAEVQKLDGEKQKVVADQNDKKASREAFVATVPAPLKAQYDAIRSKRGGLAIVAVVNNTCSGCRMVLTPSKGIEVKKAKAMVLCDSCSRILYLPQPAATETPGTATVSTPQ